MPRSADCSSPSLTAGYGNWTPGSDAGRGAELPPGHAGFFP